ncbi:hypothetical protein [Cohnella thermotolerans]|jgi:hypothetical protein|uniref:hypothetical protein n=1 Tax=Cohnella thermotolerans TaxID=329858 RepID=UPI00040A6EA3|nr:hypothetical protein [Cohnella thermotolerans]
MAWELAAYIVIAVGVAVLLSLAAAAVAVRRLLRRWNDAFARLDREAEATLQQWRRLGQEASVLAEVCRSSLKGFEALAEGGRALGEAAQTGARAAASAFVQWTERVSGLLAEAADRQTRRLEDGLDWTEIGAYLWNAWRRRVANASHASFRSGDSAEEIR